MTTRPAPYLDNRWEFLEHMDLPGELVLRAKAYLAEHYYEGVRCGGAESATRMAEISRRLIPQRGLVLHVWRTSPDTGQIITSQFMMWEDSEAALARVKGAK